MDPLSSLIDLIRTERGALVRTALREGVLPEDAVECVQEACSTFLQLLQRGEAPAAPGEWAPFVVTITRNAARNRRRRHHVARPHDAIDEIEPAGGASPEELIAEAEEHVRLRACVDSLCDTQRSVVMLRMLEERPGEDVARELGITRGHVDVLLHRAKASLRACMLDEDHAAH